MGVINFIVKFMGADAHTGMERLDAHAQKFSQNLAKNLGTGSLSSMLTSLAAGFGAIQLKDGLVNAFKTVADDAERAADASERMSSAVNASIRANTSAEGRLGNTQINTKFDRLSAGAADTRMAEFKEKYNIDYRTANPLVGALHSLMHPGARDYYNSIIADQEKYNEKIQMGTGQETAEARAIKVANRHAADAAQAEADRTDVAYGNMSGSQASRREAERKAREAVAVYMDKTSSAAERSAAFTASRAADNSVISVQAREEQARIQGLLPQIAASSLARVGGGGNVNVFGGREGALETEARLHTQYLRTIAQNSAKGLGGSDVQ